MFSSSGGILRNQKKIKLNEKSYKIPQSLYALSRLIGYEIVKSYREMFNLKVFSIIFFNHESILRNDNFIFKKMELGNIDVIRNLGSSDENMKIVFNIMKKSKVDDYVLDTRS